MAWWVRCFLQGDIPHYTKRGSGFRFFLQRTGDMEIRIRRIGKGDMWEVQAVGYAGKQILPAPTPISVDRAGLAKATAVTKDWFYEMNPRPKRVKWAKVYGDTANEP